jgi:putative aldouronate transport system substrate-binding protein
MKRLFTLLLAAGLAASLFAGGSSAGSSPASGAASSGGRKYTSLPLSDGKTTFSVFFGGIEGNLTSVNYADNAFTKKVVDETGIKLEFITASNVDETERMNVLLNSGSYPELILGNLSVNDINYYAGQGIFLALDDYHLKEYPNIARVFQEYPAVKDKISGADGKIYSLPSINDCIHCTYSNGRGWYYMPWIRDNNRKAPETTEEFTEYLRFIRDNDVNKTGNNTDEIPLVFSVDDLENATAYFAKAFMPFILGSGYFGMALYDGKVTEQYKLNEFRETLRYMAGLYKEGLIKEDSFTMTSEQRDRLVNSETQIVGVHLESWNNNNNKDPIRYAESVFVIPMLKGPTGQRWGANDNPWSSGGPGMFVTDKCKNPELAVALHDYLLNQNVALDGMFGLKGTGWTDPDPGAVGINGKPALYKALAYQFLWNQRNPANRNLTFRQGQQIDGSAEAIEWLKTGNRALLPVVTKNIGDFQEVMYNYWPSVQADYAIPQKYFIPPIALNVNDTNRIADINAVLTPYKKQAIAEFITGRRDINNNPVWNTYLADLDRIGSGEMATILQKYIK